MFDGSRLLSVLLYRIAVPIFRRNGAREDLARIQNDTLKSRSASQKNKSGAGQKSRAYTPRRHYARYAEKYGINEHETSHTAKGHTKEHLRRILHDDT